MGLSVSTNLMGAIRDLMHSPPIYKALLVPSWKPKLGSGASSLAPAASASAAASAAAATNSAQKRAASAVEASTPASADGASAAKRVPRNGAEQRLYQPPGGKFSVRSGGVAPSAASNAPQARHPAPRSLRW